MKAAIASLIFSVTTIMLTDCRSVGTPNTNKYPSVVGDSDFTFVCRNHQDCKDQAEFKCKRKDYFVVSDSITEDAGWSVLFDNAISLETMAVKCEMIKS